MENFSSQNDLGNLDAKTSKGKQIISYICLVIFIISSLSYLISAPRNFPKGVIFSIEQGSSLRIVSLNLKNQNIIQSRLLFEAFVYVYGGDKHIISADYLFEDKISVFEVARRISRGERHLAPVKITIPEGLTKYEIMDIFSAKLPNFARDRFSKSQDVKEGYLFPDTYFFFTNADDIDVVKSLNENFKTKVSIFDKDIKDSGKSKEDIIKMASIIERESKGNGDSDTISGILWKRLSINMPLQADAAPETYKAKGLPKNPIANPGLSSIKAAIYPKTTPYLYYLHDKNGNTHYAKSFAEHRVNILKYLK